MESSSGLQRLLAPKRVEDFLRNNFQRHPFVIQERDPGVYAGLLSLKQVEQAIDNFDPRDGACRLMGGEDPAARRVVDTKGELREVLVAYGRGASINISGLDRTCPTISELRRQLAGDFAAHGIPLTDQGESVVFITPANSQALKPHVDPDDLFVLQLEGRKRWKIYGWDPFWIHGKRAEPAPVLEVELLPGDLLYVPQHWIHAATAAEEFSFHVTIGFRPASWATVLASLATKHVFGLAPLFEALPPWALLGGRLTRQGQERMTAILKDLVGAPVLQQVLERFHVKPAFGTSVRSGGIAGVNRMRVIDSQTSCALSGPANVERLVDGVEIVTAEGKVKGPFAIEPALRWVAEQAGEFAVGTMGGSLSESARVVLARRLILEGVLEMRPSECAEQQLVA